MAQSPTIISESLDGTAFRLAINEAFVSLSSCYLGSVDPALVVGVDIEAGALWWNTAAPGGVPELWVRNVDNNGWVALITITGALAAGDPPSAVPAPALAAIVAGKVPLSGGTMLPAAVLSMDAGYTPSANAHVATKSYVDATSRPGDVRWMVLGTCSVQNKVAQSLIGTAAKATKITLWADTPPVGSVLAVNLVRVRPSTGDDTRAASIADGANLATLTFGTALPLLAGDRLRLDVTGIGSGTPGGNDLLATVTLVAP